ncbi:hypothetical protein [Bacillus glycinifermentans]|uniref:hypothetical protein n=2 Tax=Bacillus glycinifermentans TaxID=1664069 RepID=UPI000BC33ED0|nr:hypothetical protein [Bacillus glycinifermentans]ATH93360.1 hypothetical protein COP00_12670 [Bacillus glycinifermentans]
MKADITFGDLVEVDGYPDRIFYVDARRKVEEEDDTGVSNYVEFDLTDAINGEWLVADSSDLRLVCREQYAERFLDDFDYENYPEPEGMAFHFPEFLPELPDEEVVTKISEGIKKARDDMAKDNTKKIDELLDKYIDFMTLYELIGDENYKSYADGVLAKLKREVER